jgi:N-carbamoyl-L-amino-acid hydrolase
VQRTDRAARAIERLELLAQIGREPGQAGTTRPGLSRAEQQAHDLVATWLVEAGLTVSVDAVGNLYGRLAGSDPDAPEIWVGSHLDSVPDGGAFDGPLGVVSALAAIDRLRSNGFRPARPIGVVNFGDEEGARFGVACAGSRLITGALSGERALGLRDADGTTVADALTRQGQSIDVGRDDEALRRIGSFIELHVEQGRGLVGLGRAVGVGDAIWPHGRWRLDLLGTANHAGTTRLADRDDPMLALAVAIEAARREAEARDCLATIGKVQVEPNGVNAIPSRVTAWVDARGADEDDVRAVVTAIAAAAGVTEENESFTPSTAFDPDLVHRLSVRLDDAPVLPTGAGHDAGILAAAGIPAAMLFVRNPTGVSHSPAEFAETDDCLAGIAALAAVLEDLAGAAAS